MKYAIHRHEHRVSTPVDLFLRGSSGGLMRHVIEASVWSCGSVSIGCELQRSDKLPLLAWAWKHSRTPVFVVPNMRRIMPWEVLFATLWNYVVTWRAVRRLRKAL